MDSNTGRNPSDEFQYLPLTQKEKIHMHDNRIADAQRQAASFVEYFFEPDDVVEVKLVEKDAKATHSWCQARHLPVLATELVPEEANAYIGINPRIEAGGSEKRNIRLARCLFVEFDSSTMRNTSPSHMMAMLPVPDIVSGSLHGAQLYWRLDEPMYDLDCWTYYQAGLATVLGSDGMTTDPRWMVRFPVGTFCHPKGRLAKFHNCESCNTGGGEND